MSAPHRIEGEIEFRNLNFAYNGTPVLHDLNLRIPAGSSLAIVGPDRFGKDYAGQPNPADLRRRPGNRADRRQAAFANIRSRCCAEYRLCTAGNVPVQRKRARKHCFRKRRCHGRRGPAAAEAANIAEDIEGFPEKYRTLVGERGITLSGGQKQRTAIARAIIRNPRILILDDALSSVDTHTEDRILNHLREVMQGRTTIFISHRVSTVRNADRIAVLHAGRIVEFGTHDELIDRNGYYTDLYNKQLLEEELAEV